MVAFTGNFVMWESRDEDVGEIGQEEVNYRYEQVNYLFHVLERESVVEFDEDAVVRSVFGQ